MRKSFLSICAAGWLLTPVEAQTARSLPEIKKRAGNQAVMITLRNSGGVRVGRIRGATEKSLDLAIKGQRNPVSIQCADIETVAFESRGRLVRRDLLSSTLGAAGMLFGLGLALDDKAAAGAAVFAGGWIGGWLLSRKAIPRKLESTRVECR